MKYFIWIICIIIGASLVIGMLIVGSPAKERARKLDEQRVNGLQSIQNEIVSYWQRKKEIPKDVESLSSDFNGFTAPRDPVTAKPYEYTGKPPLSFSLCADFVAAVDKNDPSLPSNSMPYPVSPGFKSAGTWVHGAGRVCFDRTIDPDYFKSLNDPSADYYKGGAR